LLRRSVSCLLAVMPTLRKMSWKLALRR